MNNHESTINEGFDPTTDMRIHCVTCNAQVGFAQAGYLPNGDYMKPNSVVRIPHCHHCQPDLGVEQPDGTFKQEIEPLKD